MAISARSISIMGWYNGTFLLLQVIFRPAGRKMTCKGEEIRGCVRPPFFVFSRAERENE